MIAQEALRDGRFDGLNSRPLQAGPPFSRLTPISDGVFRKFLDEDTRRILIQSNVTLGDYQGITPESDWKGLTALAHSLRGKRLSWVNATAQGGGVALMRGPQMHLLGLLDVDARWYVLKPDDQAFKVTKRMHNTLQAVTPPEVGLPEGDIQVYNSWSRDNAGLLAAELAQSDVLIIDDPQPSGLIPHVLERNPTQRFIFRDHIQSAGPLMSNPETAQGKVWGFIRDHNRVLDAHCLVFHPRPEFVPGDVPEWKTVFMPPSTDLLDDLNRPLSESEIAEGINFFNGKLTEYGGQKPLDLKRGWIIQIARFDPAKGIPDVMASYVEFRERLEARGVPDEDIPDLVITGNGSIDDPDGERVLADTIELRSNFYAKYAECIKIARVPHNDMALNAILRESWVALQLSIREGFEVKATEAEYKGIPTIVTNAGGLPLQIEHDVSGYIVNPGDTSAVAGHLERLFLDKEAYLKMSQQAFAIARTKNYEFTTIPNAINWLYLCREVLRNPNFAGNRRLVREMVLASS